MTEKELVKLGYKTNTIERFAKQLYQLQSFDIRTVNYYALKVDPVYTANYLYELVVYDIDIEQANEYARKYQDRFNDFNLLFLLRAQISHKFIASCPQWLCARDIVLSHAGVINPATIELAKTIPELLTDSIQRAFISGMTTDQIQSASQDYKSLIDDLEPGKIDRYARLSLVSSVPFAYYQKKLAGKIKPRLILDHYNREQHQEKAQLLSEQLSIQQFNKAPLSIYQKMYDLLDQKQSSKPIAVYLTTNDDHGDYLLFSAWHEALSLTENYDLIIIEANSQEEILQSLKNIPHKISAIVFSYHGAETNNQQALAINASNLITTKDTKFIQELDQYLANDCQALISCCHSSKVAEMIFKTSKQISKLYAPGTVITYGCLKSLPNPIFFEDSSSLLTWS
jgi:hypothetical protein